MRPVSKICIVTHSHLCRNPRVLKEAIALSEHGYTITILTAIHSEDLLKEDLSLINNIKLNYIFYSDLRTRTLQSVLDRILRKCAITLQIIGKIETKYSLGYGVKRLRKICISEKANLYIMHQELPTVIGCELLKENYKVAFDLEDWYSEDLLPDAKRQRPIALLKRTEETALQKGICSWTTSRAMVKGLTDFYKLKKEPHAIYNTFRTEKYHPQSKNYNEKSIRLYWFSQTIGPGRGLEFFIQCLHKTNISFVLVLRGNISKEYHLFLSSIISYKDELQILSIIKNEEILEDLSNYDFGLALEPDTPANKNSTISNKFFHYLAGALPVIASITLGHLEIGIKHPEIIYLYNQNDDTGLVNLLNSLGDKIHRIKDINLKQKVFDIYHSNYTWEIEKQKLIKIVNNALDDVT